MPGPRVLRNVCQNLSHNVGSDSGAERLEIVFVPGADVAGREDNGLVGRRACLQIICSVDKIVQDGSQV